VKMPEPFKKEIRISSEAQVTGGAIDIPGDISTAAFFLATAAISRRTITVENLGLNPTRTAFLDYLKSTGCKLEITAKTVVSGEPRGKVSVTGASLKPRKISGELTVGLIDEIPIRLIVIRENLQRMGVKCGILEDGLVIEGGKELSGADFQSYGDHRIAMAFSIAALFLVGPSTIDDVSVVNISCPDFYKLMDKIIL